jgi:hypothetical protein
MHMYKSTRTKPEIEGGKKSTHTHTHTWTIQINKDKPEEHKHNKQEEGEGREETKEEYDSEEEEEEHHEGVACVCVFVYMCERTLLLFLTWWTSAERSAQSRWSEPDQEMHLAETGNPVCDPLNSTGSDRSAPTPTPWPFHPHRW